VLAEEHEKEDDLPVFLTRRLPVVKTYSRKIHEMFVRARH
jgi:hypothetical protein